MVTKKSRKSSATLPLQLYRVGMRLLRPASGLFLRYRAHKGKEDPERLWEKVGVPSRQRPDGNLAWLHGASVGESLALLPLVDRLTARGLNVLVTTGTLTSAQIMAQRLGGKVCHQFMPLDIPRFVERFLTHWHPDLVLLAESELWPNMIAAIHKRHIPMVLVNARMSERSSKRWSGLPTTIGSLLGMFDLCLAQSPEDAKRLLELGAPRVQVCGNLKYDGVKLPFDHHAFSILEAQIGTRPVWLAASTHFGEEAMVARIHRELLNRFPDLLTIIVPRHALRGQEILADLRSMHIEMALRSQRQPLSADIQLYIADTMGEMGLFYRLAPLVFIGKSLAQHDRGGHNPIEPAKLGSAILHGPEVGNFADVYYALDSAGGAVRVENEEGLKKILSGLMSDTPLLRKVGRQAQLIVNEIGGAADRIMISLEPYFLQKMIEER